MGQRSADVLLYAHVGGSLDIPDAQRFHDVFMHFLFNLSRWQENEKAHYFIELLADVACNFESDFKYVKKEKQNRFIHQ